MSLVASGGRHRAARVAYYTHSPGKHTTSPGVPKQWFHLVILSLNITSLNTLLTHISTSWSGVVCSESDRAIQSVSFSRGHPVHDGRGGQEMKLRRLHPPPSVYLVRARKGHCVCVL